MGAAGDPVALRPLGLQPQARLLRAHLLPVLLRDLWLMLLFRARHTGSQVAVNMTGKTATAVIMVSLALLMVTTAPWPQVLFGFGIVLSLAAAARYTRRPREA